MRFVDGSIEPMDVIVYSTGYRISFPFFSTQLFDIKDNHILLYRRVIPPDHPGSTSSGCSNHWGRSCRSPSSSPSGSPTSSRAGANA